MDDFWSRALALESRHSVEPGCTVPGETREDRIRQQWARDEERKREDALTAWANKRLASHDLLLVKNDIFSNPDYGKFYLRQITTGECVRRDVSPNVIAYFLSQGGQP